MKTINFILFILLLSLYAIRLQAQTKTQEKVQEPLHYKALSSFKSNAQINDTLQYLEYNFNERRSQYKGKTVADVIKDIEFPVNFIVDYAMKSYIHNINNIPSVLSSLSLGIKQMGKEPSELEDYYVFVLFEDPPKFEDFRKVFDFKSREITPEVYNFIKDLKVSSVSSNPYIIMKREKLKQGKINGTK